MESQWKISISSPPDREKLTASIFIDNQEWVELNQENGALMLEFYPRSDGVPWRISYEQAIIFLNDAKLKLLGRK